MAKVRCLVCGGVTEITGRGKAECEYCGNLLDALESDASERVIPVPAEDIAAEEALKKEIQERFQNEEGMLQRLQKNPTPREEFAWDGTVLKKYYKGDVTVDVVIPDGTTEIGEEAFANKDGINTVIIPEGVKIIKKKAFSDCSFLASVTIPSSVRIIEEGAFRGCTMLENVIFSEGVEVIGREAFSECGDLLESVMLPDSVRELGEMAFMGCDALKGILLSENLKKIGGQAFDSCGELRRIRIPAGVEELGLSVFDSCEKLKHISLPKSFADKIKADEKYLGYGVGTDKEEETPLELKYYG